MLGLTLCERVVCVVLCGVVCVCGVAVFVYVFEGVCVFVIYCAMLYGLGVVEYMCYVCVCDVLLCVFSSRCIVWCCMFV